MSLFLAAVLAWGAEKRKPPKIDCSALLAAAGEKVPQKRIVSDRQLTAVFRDLRDINGNSVRLTVEKFDADVRDMALYLIGKKAPEEMKNNHFFSERHQKIELELSLRGLHEEDLKTIQRAVNEGIQQELAKIQYSGKTSAEVIKELAGQENVLIFTHQIGSLQSQTKKIVASYPDLKKASPVLLVGAESSEPLKTESISGAKLIHHSVGGEFDFSLANAKTVAVAGGALDQCLIQTIHSIAVNTTSPEVTIQVIMPLTYVDMKGFTHLPLSEFLKLPTDDVEEYRERIREEFREFLIDDGFRFIRTEDKPLPQGQLPELSFKNKKNRVIHIEFRP